MPGSKSPKVQLFNGEDATISEPAENPFVEMLPEEKQTGRMMLMVGPKSDAGAVGNTIKEWITEGSSTNPSHTAAAVQASSSSPSRISAAVLTQVKP
jgi:hypothetical protein